MKDRISRIKQIVADHESGCIGDTQMMLAVLKEAKAHKAAGMHRVVIRGLASRMGCQKPSLGRKARTTTA